MPEDTQNQDKLPAAESRQEAAPTSDAKSKATSTATARDELSEGELQTVAGGLAKRIV